MLPLSKLGKKYTKVLGRVKGVMVVASQANTEVTVKVKGETKASKTIGPFQQVTLDASTASSKLLEVNATKPVAVFVLNNLGMFRIGAEQLSPST